MKDATAHRQGVEQADDIAFTHGWYRTFLERLDDLGYEFGRFRRDPAAGEVLLRHDVDLSLRSALTMARIEADLGVQSSYFVLLTSPIYNALEGRGRDILREIEELGHEVGVHFSTHQYWPADGPDEGGPPGTEELVDRIHAEQSVLGTVADDPLSTISFHIPPEWVLDVRFDGVQSTYEPTFFSEIEYVADSSQRWRDEPPLLDPSTDEALQLLVHPGLWDEGDAQFESRVEEAVDTACEYVREQASREFLQEVYR